MIKESIYLPSQGYPYRNVGSYVTVSPLTTRAYKDFLVNPNEEGIFNLIDSCLVDCPIKASEFVYQDELAIYFKIRSMSMGDIVPSYSVCPYCENKNNEEWNLMELECKYLSLSEYPLGVTLPESQKKVYISIPTGRTQQIAQEAAQKRATQFNTDIKDFLPSFQSASILSVEGTHDLIERAEWYNNLPLKDAVFIESVLERMQDFGIKTNHTVNCEKCKKDYLSPLKITSNFFRPDIGNITGISTATGTLAQGPSNTASTQQNS